jgi:hypothetical protein
MYKNRFKMDKKTIYLILLLFIYRIHVPVFSKNKTENIAKKDTISAIKPLVVKKKKSFDDSLKHFKKHDGLFKFYVNTVNGTILMVIKKSQINQSYIYLNYSENGTPNIGSFRGNFRENKVFSIRKSYDKLEFVTENLFFYFDSTNALSKAADANISKGVLGSSSKLVDNTESTIFGTWKLKI